VLQAVVALLNQECYDGPGSYSSERQINTLIEQRLPRSVHLLVLTSLTRRCHAFLPSMIFSSLTRRRRSFLPSMISPVLFAAILEVC
jgi:hypothetical protein